jgi:hypothetical protein
MTSDITVAPLRQPDVVDDPLTAVLREGARRLLAQAVEAEARRFSRRCGVSVSGRPPTEIGISVGCLSAREGGNRNSIPGLSRRETAVCSTWALQLQPPPAKASMPIRPSAKPYAGNPFSNRVEQLRYTGRRESQVRREINTGRRWNVRAAPPGIARPSGSLMLRSESWYPVYLWLPEVSGTCCSSYFPSHQ